MARTLGRCELTLRARTHNGAISRHRSTLWQSLLVRITISASWYPGVKEDGAEVPTWNYVVVHAYGPLRVIENPDWLYAHLVKLADIHEAGSAKPWKVTDAPPEFIREQMRAFVGLEIPIRHLEGKWKVSQNRNERDRNAVSEGLADLSTPQSLTMKKLVQSR